MSASVALWLILASQSGAAEGDTVATVENLAAEGVRLYQERRYQDARERFRRANDLYPDADLLYNAARCEKALGRIDAAMNAFRAVLEHRPLRPDTRALAEKELRDLEELVLARARELPALLPVAFRPAAAVVLPPRADDRERGPVLPWVGLGSGLAATVAGSVLVAAAVHDYSRVRAAPGYETGGVVQLTRREALDAVAAGDAKQIGGWSLLGVGAAVAVTSAIRLLLDHLSTGDSP